MNRPYCSYEIMKNILCDFRAAVNRIPNHDTAWAASQKLINDKSSLDEKKRASSTLIKLLNDDLRAATLITYRNGLEFTLPDLLTDSQSDELKRNIFTLTGLLFENDNSATQLMSHDIKESLVKVGSLKTAPDWSVKEVWKLVSRLCERTGHHDFTENRCYLFNSVCKAGLDELLSFATLKPNTTGGQVPLLSFGKKEALGQTVMEGMVNVMNFADSPPFISSLCAMACAQNANMASCALQSLANGLRIYPHLKKNLMSQLIRFPTSPKAPKVSFPFSAILEEVKTRKEINIKTALAGLVAELAVSNPSEYDSYPDEEDSASESENKPQDSPAVSEPSDDESAAEEVIQKQKRQESSKEDEHKKIGTEKKPKPKK
ncbi:hypothetical protein BLNAU_16068 [Blattamonas nauphoetae]|uniref:HEAT repeat protein n=1 Tax=Blattamonas nauphoetae TaxID=2049346 RepID=A0ABQ9XCE6_9EUKA|nr:hypothetical protein BLNAU_16068 [Blattamonas nauphoetae]